MIAVLGNPGSALFKWRRFPTSRAAYKWLDDEWRKAKARYPNVGFIPAAVLTNRVARQQVSRDGTRIYVGDVGGAGRRGHIGFVGPRAC